jgi:hypothetical protein
MAVRSSMAYIITFVRELINDPAGPDQKFTDQQIQDRLDLKRLDLYGDPLKSADTLNSDGTIAWKQWWAKLPFWETDYLIQNTSGTTKTPDTAEPLIGKFTYLVTQEQPLIITGKVYNVYGVASSLLITWIAEIRSQIQMWTADGTTIQRVGQVKNMQDLAAKYAGMAWGWGNWNQIKLVRKDLRN